jgi:hypothetical protein
MAEAAKRLFQVGNDARSGWLALAGRDHHQVLYEVSCPDDVFWFALCRDREDAELIVRAVNAHDALTRACELTKKYIDDRAWSDVEGVRALLRAVEDALKLSGEETTDAKSSST